MVVICFTRKAGKVKTSRPWFLTRKLLAPWLWECPLLTKNLIHQLKTWPQRWKPFTRWASDTLCLLGLTCESWLGDFATWFALSRPKLAEVNHPPNPGCKYTDLCNVCTHYVHIMYTCLAMALELICALNTSFTVECQFDSQTGFSWVVA